MQKACPVWRDKVTDCEKIGLIENPCHFYNASSGTCVIFDISENLRDIPQALQLLAPALQQKQPPRVLFTKVEEYCNEIRNDKEDIYRNIVRATMLIKQVHDMMGVMELKVNSSYLVGDQLIYLSMPCGEFINQDSKSFKPASDMAEAAMKQIEDTCLDCLLSYRAGVVKDIVQ